MQKQNLADTVHNLGTASQILIFTGIGLFCVKMVKKLSDFMLAATFEKYIRLIKEEVMTSVKEEIEPLKEDFKILKTKSHGVIEKNEAVLLEALRIINDNKNKK